MRSAAAAISLPLHTPPLTPYFARWAQYGLLSPYFARWAQYGLLSPYFALWAQYGLLATAISLSLHTPPLGALLLAGNTGAHQKPKNFTLISEALNSPLR